MSTEPSMIKVNVEEINDPQDLTALYLKYVNNSNAVIYKNPNYDPNSNFASQKLKYSQHFPGGRKDTVDELLHGIIRSNVYNHMKRHEISAVHDWSNPKTWHAYMVKKDPKLLTFQNFKASGPDMLTAVRKVTIISNLKAGVEPELPV